MKGVSCDLLFVAANTDFLFSMEETRSAETSPGQIHSVPIGRYQSVCEAYRGNNGNYTVYGCQRRFSTGEGGDDINGIFAKSDK